MKKICIFIFLIFCILIFSACSNKGNVSNVEIINIQSGHYSQEEIIDAIEVVKSEFIDFTGCTLTKIGYVGDDNNPDLPFAVDEPKGITLDCEFTTSHSSGEDGFNSNETYDYGMWTWYLEKNSSGEWVIVNYGVC